MDVTLGKTVKGRLSLFTPLAKTTTFPDVAPVGTVAAIEVALQLVMEAVVLLKVTEPGELPKLLPDSVTLEPRVPAAGVSVLMAGPETTVNETPLLVAVPTLTTTFPVVAPDGTMALMELALQLVMLVELVPLKVTRLEPCVEPKLLPEIVTVAPTAPLVGERLDIDGVLASADEGANRAINTRTAKIGGLTRAEFIWTHASQLDS